MVDTVTGKLLRTRSAKDEVSLAASVDDLDDNFTVGEANNQAVLGGVAVVRSANSHYTREVYALLVLGLGDKALAGVVYRTKKSSEPCRSRTKCRQTHSQSCPRGDGGT